MRIAMKVIVTQFMTLDGVDEAPENWHGPFHDQHVNALKEAELAQTGALLLGRKTYETFAATWPGRTGDFADRFNALPKFVASDSMAEVSWNGSELLSGPAEAFLPRLKQRDLGGDIFIHGSLSLVSSLISRGLVDEIHLLVDPVILGSGRGPFDGANSPPVSVIQAQSLPNGVQALKYRVHPPVA
jgi:dihydrofolate reductase